jgi:hypothetical protein
MESEAMWVTVADIPGSDWAVEWHDSEAEAIAHAKTQSEEDGWKVFVAKQTAEVSCDRKATVKRTR